MKHLSWFQQKTEIWYRKRRYVCVLVSVFQKANHLYLVIKEARSNGF
ncbi:hypothetical protein ACSBO6_19820 [Bacillus sp. AL-1R]